MNNKISLDELIDELELNTTASKDEIKEIIIDIFIHIRSNNECGKWVEIEDFGSFHPLWYKLKKYKDAQEEIKEKTIPIKVKTQEIKIPKTVEVQEVLKAITPTVIEKKEKKITKEEIQKPNYSFTKKIIDKKEAFKNISKIKIEKLKGIIPKDKLSILKNNLIKNLKSKKETLHNILKVKIETIQKINTKDKIQKIKSKIKTYKIELITLIFLILALLLYLLKFTKNEPDVYKCFDKVESTKTTNEIYYKHTVSKGENLYTISQAFYNDAKYWPLIYTKNYIDDMDIIYPGEVIKIPRILQGSNAEEELAKIYIQTYKEYKRLEKYNDANWLLYWFNENIDNMFLDKNADEISEEDKKIIEEYIKRFPK